GVAAGADGGVEQDLTRRGRQLLHHLGRHYRYVAWARFRIRAVHGTGSAKCDAKGEVLFSVLTRPAPSSTMFRKPGCVARQGFFVCKKLRVSPHSLSSPQGGKGRLLPTHSPLERGVGARG